MAQQFELGFDSAESHEPTNLLPAEGEAIYYGSLFIPREADSFLQSLLTEVEWRHDECVMFGKRIVTARQVAWFGDREFSYRYSGHSHTAHVWSPRLLEIKQVVEQRTGVSYNSCLLNRYHDGSEGMGWHQDNEKELGPAPNIASVSFGAVRRFDFRHKNSREKVSVFLQHGSLLVMRGETQRHWQHQIPKALKVQGERVNLTFRQILEL